MFKDKATEIITDYIKTNHKLIKVTPGTCRYNFYCHSNATHDAITQNHKKLAMVVYFDKGMPIIHFINYHNKQFVDNTLGVWCTRHKFYLIKFIKKKEFFKVHQIHSSYRSHIHRMLPLWIRLFRNINSI